MRRLTALTTAAVVTLVLAGCGSSSDSTSSTSASTSTAAEGSLPAYDPALAGGTLKLVAKGAAGTLDPKINYTLQFWQLYQATYDGLLAFRKTDGDKSFEVVPDLAEAMPEVSNDGKTLTFTLRDGIKFSDGNPVTVNDVKSSFERIFKVS